MAGKRAVTLSHELSSRPADGPVSEGVEAPGRETHKKKKISLCPQGRQAGPRAQVRLSDECI